MHIMQNRVLIYSKPNIGDGPPPPELRTNSTFMFCIARAQRKYNRPTEEQKMPVADTNALPR